MRAANAKDAAGSKRSTTRTLATERVSASVAAVFRCKSGAERASTAEASGSTGRRQGTDDARHLWPHVLNAVRVLRPRYLFAVDGLGRNAQLRCLGNAVVPHCAALAWSILAGQIIESEAA